eukprot:CAMPEP_0171012056 /NCGR_PEP_ID=MMETSP0736-20130129/23310_1 /TAXON_ID=186038 /ORGANISM="Fragilariopsis kerguelensis, Strain L26-C5" /LENGTH=65 /DNA_ID=CAMNT_0011445029 /DNA_START=373 /DNA_END=567 /DNA_ORIENTATION=+
MTYIVPTAAAAATNNDLVVGHDDDDGDGLVVGIHIPSFFFVHVTLTLCISLPRVPIHFPCVADGL